MTYDLYPNLVGDLSTAFNDVDISFVMQKQYILYNITNEFHIQISIATFFYIIIKRLAIKLVYIIRIFCHKCTAVLDGFRFSGINLKIPDSNYSFIYLFPCNPLCSRGGRANFHLLS